MNYNYIDNVMKSNRNRSGTIDKYVLNPAIDEWVLRYIYFLAITLDFFSS